MNESQPPVFVFLLFPFFFAGMWCTVLTVLSLVGGWRRLAASFSTTSPASGTRYFMQSGMVGVVSYNGCLTIHASSEGLRLSVLFPFRLGHPPLFIPWSELHIRGVRRFLWVENVECGVRAPSVATLRLPKRVFEGYRVVPLGG